MSTVLIVDDDPIVLSLVSEQLSAMGHKAITAGHPAKALQMLDRGSRPQLAILDISMPEMTGFELAQILHMREETAEIPVVFLSTTLENPGSFTDEDGVTAIYVTKGAPPDTLQAAVDELLPRQRS